MEKRTSTFARIVALVALAAAVVVVIVAVSSSLGGSGSDSASKPQHGQGQHAKKQVHRTKAASYVVEIGDTLTSIAHETGVSVNEILKLNPEVDPQILRAGEKLKLR